MDYSTKFADWFMKHRKFDIKFNLVKAQKCELLYFKLCALLMLLKLNTISDIYCGVKVP